MHHISNENDSRADSQLLCADTDEVAEGGRHGIGEMVKSVAKRRQDWIGAVVVVMMEIFFAFWKVILSSPKK